MAKRAIVVNNPQNTMTLKLDEHMQMVAEFMQRNIPSNKLISVAQSLDLLAPALWGRFHPEFDAEVDVPILTLSEPPVVPGRKN
jgi:hypothetical protein